MRTLRTMTIVCIVGLMLFAWMLVPAVSYSVSAAPLLAITETPQEPAQPTTPPQPTDPPQPTAPPQATEPPQPTEPPSSNPTSAPKQSDSTDNGTPDVSIVKTVDQSSASRGELMGFTLHVTNEGTATAKDVVASDTVPGYLDVLDYSVSKGTVSMSGQTLTANIGTLSTGEYVTVRFRAYLTDSAPESGNNTGTVTDSNGDSNANNNSSAVSFSVLQSLSPTPMAPTEAPVFATPEQPAPPAPTAQPPAPKPPASDSQTARRPPAGLPNTSDGNDQTVFLFPLMLVSLVVCGIGWAVRRRALR